MELQILAILKFFCFMGLYLKGCFEFNLVDYYDLNLLGFIIELVVKTIIKRYSFNYWIIITIECFFIDLQCIG